MTLTKIKLNARHSKDKRFQLVFEVVVANVII